MSLATTMFQRRPATVGEKTVLWKTRKNLHSIKQMVEIYQRNRYHHRHHRAVRIQRNAEIEQPLPINN